MNFESLETRELLDLAARDVRFNNEPMFTAVTKRLAEYETVRCNTLAALHQILAVTNEEPHQYDAAVERVRDIARASL